MARVQTASDIAKSLLHSASRSLLTADPTYDRSLTDALDDALGWPLYKDQHIANGERHFEPNFAETSANALSFAVSPGGQSTTLSDKLDIASQSFRRMVGEHFGPSALNWADGRMEPYIGARQSRGRGFGAMFSAGLDRGGLAEASATFDWGPESMDGLPSPVYQIARIAMDALPGLVPFLTTVHCGRRSGGQHVTFEISHALDLNNLKPLMDVFGIGHRHGALMSLTAFILGARFTLPPATSTLTLLRSRNGVEMRIDVNLDALPDAPAQLLPLLRLPMTERPRSLQALDRWMTAMTPDGYYGPGSVSVLSIRTRSDMPPRVAVYLRPAEFSAGEAEEAQPEQQVSLPPQAAPGPPQPIANGEIQAGQMPNMGGGLRS